jgi:hypothetical protein
MLNPSLNEVPTHFFVLIDLHYLFSLSLFANQISKPMSQWVSDLRTIFDMIRGPISDAYHWSSLV